MPARLPDEVKRRRGTLQKCRANPRAPTARPSRVGPPPRGVSPTYRATHLRLAKQVEALGCFAESDRSAFDLLVTMLTLVAEAPADTPPTATVRLLQAAAAQLGRFGLDPASRGKVSVAAAPADPAHAFLFNGPRLVAAGEVER